MLVYMQTFYCDISATEQADPIKKLCRAMGNNGVGVK